MRLAELLPPGVTCDRELVAWARARARALSAAWDPADPALAGLAEARAGGLHPARAEAPAPGAEEPVPDPADPPGPGRAGADGSAGPASRRPPPPPSADALAARGRDDITQVDRPPSQLWAARAAEAGGLAERSGPRPEGGRSADAPEPSAGSAGPDLVDDAGTRPIELGGRAAPEGHGSEPGASEGERPGGSASAPSAAAGDPEPPAGAPAVVAGAGGADDEVVELDDEDDILVLDDELDDADDDEPGGADDGREPAEEAPEAPVGAADAGPVRTGGTAPQPEIPGPIHDHEEIFDDGSEPPLRADPAEVAAADERPVGPADGPAPSDEAEDDPRGAPGEPGSEGAPDPSSSPDEGPVRRPAAVDDDLLGDAMDMDIDVDLD